MGGVVPKGETNDELIDNLVEGKFIQKPENIQVFRAVDRGDFFPGDFLEDAYRDMAMRSGNFHMSAPCIYCSLLENFELETGLSFLNIGSGTGYLSTLIGLLIGPYGTNHGIELYQDVIDYASVKIEEFIRFSDGFDLCHFIKPTFVKGNISCLETDFRKYDRVYCGARVSNENIKEQIKTLVNVGGVLVFPYGDNVRNLLKMLYFKHAGDKDK